MSVLSVYNYGTVYDLDDGALFQFLEYEGFGMSPLHRLRERGPQQDGETDLGYRLDPRLVGLKILAFADTLADAYTRQQSLLTAFSPVGGEALQLRYTTPAGSVRYLDCYLSQGLDFRSVDLCRYDFAAIAQCNAPDPTWYNGTQSSTAWGYTISDELAFPCGFPIEFGSDMISATQTVNYSGNWKSYPQVVFTGPLTAPQIRNVTTNRLLKLNTTIAAGKSVTIDCRYGYKTVLQNDGTDFMGYLSSDSDLDFYVAAAPEATGGVNTFTAVGGGAVAGQSTIQLNYYERFTGVY